MARLELLMRTPRRLPAVGGQVVIATLRAQFGGRAASVPLQLARTTEGWAILLDGEPAGEYTDPFKATYEALAAACEEVLPRYARQLIREMAREQGYKEMT